MYLCLPCAYFLILVALMQLVLDRPLGGSRFQRHLPCSLHGFFIVAALLVYCLPIFVSLTTIYVDVIIGSIDVVDVVTLNAPTLAVLFVFVVVLALIAAFFVPALKTSTF